MEYKGLRIGWLGHSGFRIGNSKTIYIDPYQIKSRELADILLITHGHYDHCSPEDVRKISSENTVIVTTKACKDKLSGLNVRFVTVEPGKKFKVDDVEVEATTAYNVNKFRSPGMPFHPKGEGVGFVLRMNGIHVYHAGDTDFIPGMKEIKADITLLPVSGTYVMTAEEAAKAANVIKPEIAIPMHIKSVVGTEEDAKRFKELAECEVEILDIEE